MFNTPCRNECEYLIDLAKRLERHMGDSGKQMQEWHDQAGKLLQTAYLETLQGEAELEQLSLQLRTAWLRHANHISSRYLKSPPHFQMVYLPSGDRNPFPYDRWNKPGSLEMRATAYHTAPAGWTAEHVMFNSGMGAITCLLQVMRNMYQPKADSALSLHGIGGYFEIMDIMKDSHDELFQFKVFTDQNQFQQSVADGGSQLIYIEPVYTLLGDLHVFDLDGFLRAWHQRDGKQPTTIVLDTTFVGNRFPVKEFLAQLDPQTPRVVIQISSTLKLDQEGLEFSNAGLMSIYSNREEITSGVGKRMRKFRAAMGLGLTLEQTAALDYPGFLDQNLCERHSAAVFENNALLARSLDTGPGLLFTGKSHPVLQAHPDIPWAVAPFVNVHLKTDTDIYDRALLKHVIFKEANQRGLLFQPGSSFGFRTHRIETSIQAEQGIQVIRVAMGCRSCPSLEGVITLLNEFSRMGSFSNLRDRYPKLAEKARRTAHHQY